MKWIRWFLLPQWNSVAWSTVCDYLTEVLSRLLWTAAQGQSAALPIIPLWPEQAKFLIRNAIRKVIHQQGVKEQYDKIVSTLKPVKNNNKTPQLTRYDPSKYGKIFFLRFSGLSKDILASVDAFLGLKSESKPWSNKHKH